MSSFMELVNTNKLKEVVLLIGQKLRLDWESASFWDITVLKITKIKNLVQWKKFWMKQKRIKRRQRKLILKTVFYMNKIKAKQQEEMICKITNQIWKERNKNWLAEYTSMQEVLRKTKKIREKVKQPIK